MTELLSAPVDDVLARSISMDGGPPASEAPPYYLLQGISGFRKAAILMMQLGREESARVLGVLSDQELEDITAEVSRIGEVPPLLAAAVLDEFSGLMMSGAHSTRGGMDHAREMLIASVGPARAAEILDRVAENLVDLPFSFLQHSDPRQIVSYVGDEHPQTIALVLAHMPAGQASQILAGLPGDLRADVAHRIAIMDRTSPDVIRLVERSLQRRLSSVLTPNELSTVGGVQPLVDIINRADRSTEKLILEGLEQRDSKLAEEVRGRMFMFDDLVGLDDRAVQLLVRQVDMVELATALKGVLPQVHDKIVRNMSERAEADLVDEIEVLGKVRLNVVETAQASIVRTIRTLEEAGQIVVTRGDEDDFVD
jgi:flagellar motor switch protein FliG